jgi:hypothetical protein
MATYYNPKSANPFAHVNSEWTTNNLLLSDPVLRRKAGVAVLDSDITEILSPRSQAGGGAVGAPFHMQHYASPSSTPYDQVLKINSSAWVPQAMPVHKLAATQNGGARGCGY